MASEAVSHFEKFYNLNGILGHSKISLYNYYGP